MTEDLPTGSMILPITMPQFEKIVNEVVNELNQLTAPDGKLDGNYVAQVVMQVIHGLDHKIGRISKTDLLNGCINRISNNVTFYAVEAMRQRLEEQLKAKQPETPSETPKPGLQLVNDVPVS